MGGYFGVASKRKCISDLFFGVDYHSHLGTRIGGLAAFDEAVGLQRVIHNIEHAPFRTKFDSVFSEMTGNSGIGCISDSEPQPLIIRSHLGAYALCVVGRINNSEELIKKYFDEGRGHFNAMTGGKVNATELVAALIDERDSFAEGISFAQEVIQGTAAVMILTNDGAVIGARDRFGRIPMLVGKDPDGYALSFESFAYQKLGYEDEKELGPGEIVEVRSSGIKVLKKPNAKKKICAFLWSYYGYPTSTYEGVNVEVMRYKNGGILAKNDKESGEGRHIDYVGGVPDSGTPHAIGYANVSHLPFARAFIKYTPTWARSFMPTNPTDRKQIAKMKQIPVNELIKDKDLLFVDDSIVRGTQLRETVEFLYENGAKSVHMRSACPPIMYSCKYLNFTRATDEMELIARREIMEMEGRIGLDHMDEYRDGSTERGRKLREAICKKLNLASLEFQTLEGVIEAIGIDPCELCTYCWTGEE